MHVLPFWNKRLIILGNVLIVFYCLQGALARVLESIKASSRTARVISLFQEFQGTRVCPDYHRIFKLVVIIILEEEGYAAVIIVYHSSLIIIVK